MPGELDVMDSGEGDFGCRCIVADLDTMVADFNQSFFTLLEPRFGVKLDHWILTTHPRRYATRQ